VAQVEKAPIVLKAGVKKEEAEELQKKLEAGATISRSWLVSDCDIWAHACYAVPLQDARRKSADMYGVRMHAVGAKIALE
jgi:Ribosomal protein L7/L12 C-terminal domain